MKNKVTNSEVLNLDKTIAPEKKVKSLRPMRSMVAVRSFKPRTAVAAMTMVRPVPENK
ncbi:MAG TPA: hypothetical protein VNJ01_03215 [Bacteriovoracaceae bacterium]|nr:hypothetical protein [Bacteriovoracaceae bacterium]